MDNKTPQQRREERRKYLRIQRTIRMGLILLAIVLSIAALYQSCAARRAVEDLAAQLQAKKAAQVEVSEMPEASPSPSAAPAGTLVTLSFVGDCTLGMDESAAYDGSFAQCYGENGDGYFFENVKSLFEGDDLTVANLECAFTQSGSRADKLWAFRADPSCAGILSAGGIDAVSVANEHTHDYGDEGYVDTLANLDNAGVRRFGYDSTLLLEVGDGVTVGLLGLWQGDGDSYEDEALREISDLRAKGAQIVVAELHWGQEYEYTPEAEQTALAHRLVDAGADLVIGHHPHVLQGIERYHGKYIAYSLGTFCYGGESSVPDYDTVIFRQTFTLVDGVCQGDAALELIPCSVSSEAGTNDYRPTPLSGSEAQRILEKVADLSSGLEGGLQTEDLTNRS